MILLHKFGMMQMKYCLGFVRLFTVDCFYFTMLTMCTFLSLLYGYMWATCPLCVGTGLFLQTLLGNHESIFSHISIPLLYRQKLWNSHCPFWSSNASWNVNKSVYIFMIKANKYNKVSEDVNTKNPILTKYRQHMYNTKYGKVYIHKVTLGLRYLLCLF